MKQFKSFLFVLLVLFILTGCEGITSKSYESQFKEITYSECTYILNRNTHKFHYKNCYTIEFMHQENKVYCNDTRENIVNNNYTPCKKCNP